MEEAPNSSTIEVQHLMEHHYVESNLSCVRISHNVTARVVMYLLLVFATTVTILGNSVVVISIAHFKQLHTPTNILVMSLALVDLLMGLTDMPFSMINTVEGCWYFGKEFCYWHAAFDSLLTDASILHLICIAVDRHQAVCYPLQYPTRVTLPVSGIMAALSWVVATVYVFNTVGTQLNKLNDYLDNCYVVITALCASLCTSVFFILPVCVMVVLYAQVFFVSQRHARQIKIPTEGKTDMTSSKLSQKTKREKKAAKTLGIIVGTFIACWMPYFIITFVDVFSQYRTPAVLHEIFYWLSFINSTFNPIIYGLFYPWFRKTLYLIVTLKIFAPNSSELKVYAA